MPKLSPKIVTRTTNKNAHASVVHAGYSPVVALVLANRTLPGIDPLSLINPSLQMLEKPDGLPDIDSAASRIALAVISQERIAQVCDFDVDGTSSRSLIYLTLTEIFGVDPDLISHHIGNRLTEGYGVSDYVVDRILASKPQPNIVITADQGSSDEPRIKRLKAAGIDTIVSDHHALPLEGYPRSAYACVTPARSDTKYTDSTIAGCMVSFLLMSHVRKHLIDCGYLDSNAPHPVRYLGLVAAATVADCVDLRSINNRAVISAGLRQINQASSPAWYFFRNSVCKPDQQVTAETLAFSLGPNINSRSRVADAMASFHFMVAGNQDDAKHYWAMLAESNEQRKSIERDMCDHAIEAVFPQVQSDRLSIVYYGPDFSPGVHGIVASRLVEAYGRPTVLFSPMQDKPGILSGSARTIPGVHVKDAFDYVLTKHPGIAISAGGHRGAGGIKIVHDNLDLFSQTFDEAVRQQISPDQIGPVLDTDGHLHPEDISLRTVDELSVLEPYGREFPPPSFVGDFEVSRVRAIGDGSHLSAILVIGGITFQAVWFRAIDASGRVPISTGRTYRMVYAIADNVYRGNRSLQLKIQNAVEV